MGQDHEKALTVLKECAEKGEWLCLQNLHLVIPWVSKLLKELCCLQFHKNFKLWITSEEHSKFPPLLLKKCLKITTESPPGIKNNLVRTYQHWSPDLIERHPVSGAQTLFILSWFHAIIQERRLYVPEGWTKFYEFSSTDLMSSSDIILVKNFYIVILLNSF